MKLFAKTKKASGWMAVSFQNDGIYLAHISRSAASQPAVESIAFFPAENPPSAGALEKAGKEVHANQYQCTTVLATGEYQLLSVDAPNVPPDELKTAIRWRLKDMLDFHIDDATIDVLDVPLDKNAPGHNHSMYAVVARSQRIQQRQAVFEEACFSLSVIDIPEMAQRNITALFTPEDRGIAMLSLGQDGGLLTVTYSGELYLSRRIDIGLTQLAQAKAEQRPALFDRITLELQRSLDHFDRQFHFITLSKLLLAPLGDAGAGLLEYLASNLHLPVESIELESVLDISRVPELKAQESQQKYFMTLGAALRHEEKVL